MAQTTKTSRPATIPIQLVILDMKKIIASFCDLQHHKLDKRLLLEQIRPIYLYRYRSIAPSFLTKTTIKVSMTDLQIYQVIVSQPNKQPSTCKLQSSDQTS